MYIYFIFWVMIQYYFVLLNLFQLGLLGTLSVGSWAPLAFPNYWVLLFFSFNWGGGEVCQGIFLFVHLLFCLFLVLLCFLALQDTPGSFYVSPAPLLESVISPSALVPSLRHRNLGARCACCYGVSLLLGPLS